MSSVSRERRGRRNKIKGHFNHRLCAEEAFRASVRCHVVSFMDSITANSPFCHPHGSGEESVGRRVDSHADTFVGSASDRDLPSFLPLSLSPPALLPSSSSFLPFYLTSCLPFLLLCLDLISLSSFFFFFYILLSAPSGHISRLTGARPPADALCGTKTRIFSYLTRTEGGNIMK